MPAPGQTIQLVEVAGKAENPASNGSPHRGSPAHRCFPVAALRSPPPTCHKEKPTCGHRVTPVALQGPALSCSGCRFTAVLRRTTGFLFPRLLPWAVHVKTYFQTPLPSLLPKEMHSKRTGHCNVNRTSEQQEEGTKGRMWDNEQILTRCLAGTGCGAAREAQGR